MTNNPVVLEQTIDVALGEARNSVEIEIMERGAEVLPLAQDGAPAQSGLETLQTQFLEQAMIIFDRKAPLGVVIGEKIRRRGGPAAPFLAVGTNDRAHRSGVFARQIWTLLRRAGISAVHRLLTR